MSAMHFQEWLKLEGVRDFLNSFTGRVPAEMMTYLQSLPDEDLQQVIGQVKRNPRITQQEIEAILSKRKGRGEANTPQEQELAATYPQNIQKWMLSQLRILREKPGQLQWHQGFWVDYPTAMKELTAKRDIIINWMEHAHPELQELSIENVLEEIKEWEKVLQGQGGGRYYEPAKSENIIYGPQWKNEQWNGWTVQKVKSENDLGAEGERMDHCVGGYCQSVSEGNTVIYSLRDARNRPHITMNYKPRIRKVVEIRGVANSYPKEQYKAMLTEWFKNDTEVVHDDGDADKLMSDYQKTMMWRQIGLRQSDAGNIKDIIKHILDEKWSKTGVTDRLEQKMGKGPRFDNEWGYRLKDKKLSPPDEIPEVVKNHIFHMFTELMDEVYYRAKKQPPAELFEWMDRAIEGYVEKAVENDKNLWQIIKKSSTGDMSYMGENMMSFSSNIIKLDELVSKLYQKQPEAARAGPSRSRFKSWSDYKKALKQHLDQHGYDLPSWQGGKDNMISYEFLRKFVDEIGSVPKKYGDHWFKD